MFALGPAVPGSGFPDRASSLEIVAGAARGVAYRNRLGARAPACETVPERRPQGPARPASLWLVHLLPVYAPTMPLKTLTIPRGLALMFGRGRLYMVLG